MIIALSSIFADFIFEDEKAVEQLLDALDEAYERPKWQPTVDRNHLISDPEELRRLMIKGGYMRGTNWISVKEKLPDPLTTVLLYLVEKKYGKDDIGCVYVGWRDSNGSWVTANAMNALRVDESSTVTHWMLLPPDPTVRN